MCVCATMAVPSAVGPAIEDYGYGSHVSTHGCQDEELKAFCKFYIEYNNGLLAREYTSDFTIRLLVTIDLSTH